MRIKKRNESLFHRAQEDSNSFVFKVRAPLVRAFTSLFGKSKDVRPKPNQMPMCRLPKSECHQMCLPQPIIALCFYFTIHYLLSLWPSFCTFSTVYFELDQAWLSLAGYPFTYVQFTCHICFTFTLTMPHGIGAFPLDFHTQIAFHFVLGEPCSHSSIIPAGRRSSCCMRSTLLCKQLYKIYTTTLIKA